MTWPGRRVLRTGWQQKGRGRGMDAHSHGLEGALLHGEGLSPAGKGALGLQRLHHELEEGLVVWFLDRLRLRAGRGRGQLVEGVHGETGSRRRRWRRRKRRRRW